MKRLALLVQEYRRLRGLRIQPRQAFELAEFYVQPPWVKIFGAIVFIALAVLALIFAPDAIAAEMDSRIIEGVISCLNGKGMIVNGEVWICTATGVRGVQ